MQNLYLVASQVLGIPYDASPEAIRAAYRELALRWHPDRAGTDPAGIREFTARFQAIQAAYELLLDEEKRRGYEAQRATWLAEQHAVDCPRCACVVRLKPDGRAQRCSRCKTTLTEETTGHKVATEAKKLADGAVDLAEQFVEATVDIGRQHAAEATGEFRRLAFDYLRGRLGLKTPKAKERR